MKSWKSHHQDAEWGSKMPTACSHLFTPGLQHRDRCPLQHVCAHAEDTNIVWPQQTRSNCLLPPRNSVS